MDPAKSSALALALALSPLVKNSLSLSQPTTAGSGLGGTAGAGPSSSNGAEDDGGLAAALALSMSDVTAGNTAGGSAEAAAGEVPAAMASADEPTDMGDSESEERSEGDVALEEEILEGVREAQDPMVRPPNSCFLAWIINVNVILED